MRTSVVCASALLSAVSGSAVQNGERELQSDDVACKVAEYLDERSLIDFSKSAQVFSRGGRKVIGIRMAEHGGLWAGPYPGPMIECESEEEWDKLADQIGKSDKRAILTFGDEYAFFRGVPEDADPGYTGQFIGTEARLRQSAMLLAGDFGGKRWAQSVDGDHLVVRLVDENFDSNPEILIEDPTSAFGWIDPRRIVLSNLKPGSLEIFERDPALTTGIGDHVHSFPIRNQFKLRRPHDYEGLELVTLSNEANELDGGFMSLTYLVYRLDQKEIPDPQTKTVRFSFNDKQVFHRFSKDGRFIVTLQHNGPMLAITDTFDGSVKETFIHHRSKGKCIKETRISEHYCLILMSDEGSKTTTLVFLDLHTAEIIGDSEMKGTDSECSWTGQDLFLCWDHFTPFLRSIHQPRARIPVPRGTTEMTARSIRAAGQFMFGEWEKK